MTFPARFSALFHGHWLLLPALLLLPLGSLRAQGPGNGGPRPDATAVPIDAGASVLLGLGAAYGLRRLRTAKTR